MKRFIAAFMIFIVLYAVSFSAFSFKVDGIDNGIEWDGAMVYKLVDGESNCGVDFGLVKVKFDYDSNAVCLCFYFTDPDLNSDNKTVGVLIKVDDSASFEIIASDTSLSENIAPYSFESAIYVDDNNGATCEIVVGIKSGLPESIDFDARFIDSNGYYSDFYHFVVVNELYETTEATTILPTADNDDPAYNSELLTIATEKSTRMKTTRPSTTRKTTTKKTTTKKSTTTKSETYKYDTDSEDYSHTRRKLTMTDKSETHATTFKTTKAKTEKVKEKIYYYEKEVYISEVYVTVSEVVTSDVSETTVTEIVTSSESNISLSKGSKYKKFFAVAGLIAFMAIAFAGTYSAKKSKNHTENKD